MTTYRILESDQEPRVAVKKGFCWPAAFFGVFWALYKRFWPGVPVLLGVFVITNAITYVAEGLHSEVATLVSLPLLIAVTYLVGRYANIAFLAHLTRKGYRVVEEVNADSPKEAFRAFDHLRSATDAVRLGVEESNTSEPLGFCPNCDSPLPLSAAQCRKCKAQFSADSAWKVRLTKNA